MLSASSSVASWSGWVGYHMKIMPSGLIRKICPVAEVSGCMASCRRAGILSAAGRWLASAASTRPCVAAIDELARNYRASVVLCTATQPALVAPDFEDGLNEVRELAPDPDRLFTQLERVRVRHLGVLDDEALAGHMRSREQVLCIVNNRRHARAVYQAMADLPGARHLTTLMCARHRSEVLAEVRQMLKEGKPCRLVSTSLIEAGVDVDFPTVLRAEAGLDSIAQAAGRCNREGRRARDTSELLVFLPGNPDWAPPPELKQYAEKAREVLRQFEAQPLAPEAIQRYFSLLYWQKGSQALDVPDLLGQLTASRFDSLPMETLAAKFRLIDSVQIPVIVPYDDKARDALRALEHAQGSVGLARSLQPYLVQLPRQGFDALRKAGAVVPVAEGWVGLSEITATRDGLVIVERDNQKGILIGKGGSMLRTIGQGARLQMQKLISGPVYLELFVKVVPGWRSHPARLAELGYRGD